MASILRVSDVLNQDGTSGVQFNPTTGRTDIVVGNWVVESNGGVLTPIGRTRVTFSFTGADQSFVVPGGVSRIFVKLWGAGGGSGRAGGWTYGAEGGGGGHARGLIPVTPGETITVRVGQGGVTASSTAVIFGGGGMGPTGGNEYSGSGGGGCYIFRSTTPLLIAGGGGGGGASRAWTSNIGGAGGGLVGENGEAPFDGQMAYAGFGGTQIAGGSGGTGGGAGSLYQGGRTTSSWGAGGGGGYYGGGAGGYVEDDTMAGGGGGSGFVASGVLLGGTFGGSKRLPGFYWDDDLSHAKSALTNIAYGGPNPQNAVAVGTQTGGNAFCVIYF